MKAMNFNKVKITAIADVPIKVSPDAEAAVQSFAAGEAFGLWLSLDQSETVQARIEAKCAVEELAAKLPVCDIRTDCLHRAFLCVCGSVHEC